MQIKKSNKKLYSVEMHAEDFFRLSMFPRHKIVCLFENNNKMNRMTLDEREKSQKKKLYSVQEKRRYQAHINLLVRTVGRDSKFFQLKFSVKDGIGVYAKKKILPEEFQEINDHYLKAVLDLKNKSPVIGGWSLIGRFSFQVKNQRGPIPKGKSERSTKNVLYPIALGPFSFFNHACKKHARIDYNKVKNEYVGRIKEFKDKKGVRRPIEKGEQLYFYYGKNRTNGIKCNVCSEEHKRRNRNKRK